MQKKKKTGSEAFEEALRKSFSDYHRQFPESEREIYLGKDYDDYMNRLIRRSKNPFPRYFDTVGKRTAGIAAAMLIAFGCSMTVSAVREPVVSFCANTYENFMEIFFDRADIEKAPSVIETAYTLGFVPEGYELDDEYISEKNRVYIWKNAKGGSIQFAQNTLDGIFNIDNETENYGFIDIDGVQVFLKEKYGMKTYFWNTEDYRYNLRVIDDEISMEQCMNIIRSIEEYKK